MCVFVVSVIQDTIVKIMLFTHLGSAECPGDPEPSMMSKEAQLYGRAVTPNMVSDISNNNFFDHCFFTSSLLSLSFPKNLFFHQM